MRLSITKRLCLGTSNLVVHVSDYYSECLGFESQPDHNFFSQSIYFKLHQVISESGPSVQRK